MFTVTIKDSILPVHVGTLRSSGPHELIAASARSVGYNDNTKRQQSTISIFTLRNLCYQCNRLCRLIIATWVKTWNGNSNLAKRCTGLIWGGLSNCTQCILDSERAALCYRFCSLLPYTEFLGAAIGLKVSSSGTTELRPCFLRMMQSCWFHRVRTSSVPWAGLQKTSIQGIKKREKTLTTKNLTRYYGFCSLHRSMEMVKKQL